MPPSLPGPGKGGRRPGEGAPPRVRRWATRYVGCFLWTTRRLYAPARCAPPLAPTLAHASSCQGGGLGRGRRRPVWCLAGGRAAAPAAVTRGLRLPRRSSCTPQPYAPIERYVHRRVGNHGGAVGARSDGARANDGRVVGAGRGRGDGVGRGRVCEPPASSTFLVCGAQGGRAAWHTPPSSRPLTGTPRTVVAVGRPPRFRSPLGVRGRACAATSEGSSLTRWCVWVGGGGGTLACRSGALREGPA